MAKKKQEIYLLYSCNEWKEYSSMRLIMATTDIDQILKVIRKWIKAGDIVYQSEEFSKKKQLEMFNADLDYRDDIYGVIGLCDYCCLDVVNDGEEQ